METRSDGEPTGRRSGRVMIYLAWLMLLATLTLLFRQGREGPSEPFMAATEAGEVTLARSPGGHYFVDGEINNHPVRFLVDTGATEIMIPVGVAQRLGLRPGPQTQAQTANGTITIYLTRLDSVNIAGIRQENMLAAINPSDDDDTLLLGMRFLKHLELEQRGETLTLRVP